MRNRISTLLAILVMTATRIFADTSSVTNDSIIKPFTPPNQGPLGIDTMTGVVLYSSAIIFAVLVLALWRKNIMSAKKV